MRVIVLFVALFFSLPGRSQGERQKVLELMAGQELAWNRGDIKGFMEPYWHSDSLRFIGSKGITLGWQNTLNNYLKAYDTPEKMGRLHFTILHIDDSCGESMHVTGRWQLEREKPVGGYFTLLWRKIGGQWVIVSDHTS